MGCNCHYRCNCRHYGVVHFLGDVFMTVVTSGLWLIWVFCREMRRR